MSKLGFHISSGNRRGFGECLRKSADAGNPVSVVFAMDQDVWPDVEKYSPQTVVVYRTQHNSAQQTIGDGPGSMYYSDPVKTARDWMAEMMPMWAKNKAHYYAPLNEQDPPTLEGFEWINAFTIECMNVADIYYYPVDCTVQVDSGDFLDFCDINVCYTNHGRELTLQAYPHLTNLRQMPHGVDTKAFYPATSDEILRWRQDLFRIDPETTLVVNVNRNSTRKQIPYSMAAFKEFKKRHPKSRMYIHAATIDQGGDLSRAIEDLGMDIRTDIILPTNYSPAHPLKVSVLNQIYNCADLFLTTHLGEGWG